jgi:hypothetical protein
VTRDIPVFIVSALDQSWVRTRRSKIKFAGYFRKPIELTALKERVSSLCAPESQAGVSSTIEVTKL